jgi:hypothetical protein
MFRFSSTHKKHQPESSNADTSTDRGTQAEIAPRLLRVLSHDRNGLRRRNIETWRPIVVPTLGLEVLLNDLLSARESVATVPMEKRLIDGVENPRKSSALPTLI